MLLGDGVHGDQGLVQAQVQIPVLVPDVGDAAGHTGREVLAGGTQDHHPAAGHVLAAVVAHALHDGPGAGVAHGEALAGHTVDEGLAAGGAVQGHVADDDVLLGLILGVLGGIDDDLAAG